MNQRRKKKHITAKTKYEGRKKKKLRKVEIIEKKKKRHEIGETKRIKKKLDMTY